MESLDVFGVILEEFSVNFFVVGCAVYEAKSPSLYFVLLEYLGLKSKSLPLLHHQVCGELERVFLVGLVDISVISGAFSPHDLAAEEAFIAYLLCGLIRDHVS